MSYDSEVLADSPAFYLKLDETSGTTCADSSGNGIGFTYQTGVSLNQSTVCPAGVASVKTSGTAGAAVHTGVPTSLASLGTVTLEIWANITSTSEHGLLMSAGSNGGAGMGIGLANAGANGNHLIWLSPGVGWIDSGVNLGTGAMHLVITRGTQTKFYKNGSLIATKSNLTVNATDVGIGVGSDNGNGLPMPSTESLDNAAIYVAELTSTRILAHYNAGIATGGGGTPGRRMFPDALRRQAIIRASSY